VEGSGAAAGVKGGRPGFGPLLAGHFIIFRIYFNYSFYPEGNLTLQVRRRVPATEKYLPEVPGGYYVDG
jgi:hypothetical protein